jgi:3-methyladenine DNA glycosylase AlkC
MAERLKDRFFQRAFFARLAAEIGVVYPPFDGKRFQALVFDPAWPRLELKARMRHATEALGRTLPTDYREALRILLDVERHFDGFDHLLFADFVERYGVDDPEASLPALERFTRTSAEFAIRPFIRRDSERTLARMLVWASHPDERVRRLASEGCRPRLPWGTALAELKDNPSPILPILERLKDDPSESVRRSVANNLGDIAKDHPELAVSIGARWISESADRAPLVKHALRDLLKKGHTGALRLFGVGGGARVAVESLRVIPTRVHLGGTATLSIVLRSTASRPQSLRLEYALTYARPGGRTGRKVFKISDVTMEAGASLDVTRRLNFTDRTTRSHHAGPHLATLVVNGQEAATARFSLVSPAPARGAARRRTRR